MSEIARALLLHKLTAANSINSTTQVQNLASNVLSPSLTVLHAILLNAWSAFSTTTGTLRATTHSLIQDKECACLTPAHLALARIRSGTRASLLLSTIASNACTTPQLILRLNPAACVRKVICQKFHQPLLWQHAELSQGAGPGTTMSRQEPHFSSRKTNTILQLTMALLPPSPSFKSRKLSMPFIKDNKQTSSSM